MSSPDLEALAALQAPSWPPPLRHRVAMQSMAERVEGLYRDLRWWTELDLRLKNVDWPMNDISCWPLDVWCVFASGQDLFLVGNVNTASRLEDVGRIYGLPVTVVVSMLQPRDEGTRSAVGVGDILRRAVCASLSPRAGRSCGSQRPTAKPLCATVRCDVAACLQRPLAAENEPAVRRTLCCAVSLLRRPQQRSCYGLRLADYRLWLLHRGCRGQHSVGTQRRLAVA